MSKFVKLSILSSRLIEQVINGNLNESYGFLGGETQDIRGFVQLILSQVGQDYCTCSCALSCLFSLEAILVVWCAN